MRFFTWNWWQKGEDDPQAGTKYRTCVELIRDKLPMSVQGFMIDVRLHDARLLSQNRNEDAKTLELALSVYDLDDEEKRLSVMYRNVRSVSIGSHEGEFPENTLRWGALGYDEFDLSSGAVEHRMLFSEGVELKVVFESLEYAYGSL